ncbi:MAG: DinB family protein [Ignavibacteria bacterium]|nr:DinB family protein [Ignavibacteria bacterium]MCC7158610.1 DinB family protein [Ignavibacteria bacterium]
MPNSNNNYLITDIEGYTPEISKLVSMMNYARSVTIESVQNLTLSQLDYLLDEKANSIGALLMHIASTDFFYRIFSLQKRELTTEEDKEWAHASYLGEPAREHIKENSIDYYLEALMNERNKVLEMLKSVDDDWLYEEMPFWNGKPANNFFIWFHVFEDEINHRGQINLIKKRIPKNINE